MAQVKTGPMPEGLQYVPDFLSVAEEVLLVKEIQGLPFADVKMHGVVAKRRTVHFGWFYGYESWQLAPGPPIPEFLEPWCRRAAELIQIDSRHIAEVLVTEYAHGAGIGWHRDAPMFGPSVVGLSLLHPCRFRFQRTEAGRREVFTLALD